MADRVLVFSALSFRVNRQDSQGLEVKKQEETSVGRRCCTCGLAATWVRSLWSPGGSAEVGQWSDAAPTVALLSSSSHRARANNMVRTAWLYSTCGNKYMECEGRAAWPQRVAAVGQQPKHPWKLIVSLSEKGGMLWLHASTSSQQGARIMRCQSLAAKRLY